MAHELSWDHHFCLTCDKQTNEEIYCSESCRLADYEGTVSTPGSGLSSPSMSGPSNPWPSHHSTTANSKFFLPPAYDFTNAQPYGSKKNQPSLSPSSSHTSLCSMQSNASVSTTASQLSETARRELQAYAGSFGQARTQRRRSY